MLTVPVEIKKSEIHGYGVFAKIDIQRDSVVWMFHPGLDRRIDELTIKFCDPQAREFIQQRGYVNPKKQIVLCVDEAQFMNFPRTDQPPNLCLGGVQDGEHMLLAAVDIFTGDELTVPPESDADYQRKIKAYESR